MSYVQKNMKFLKAKQKNLDFFVTYLDISKLRVLQLLNEEQKALDSMRLIRHTNSKFLEQINNNFFKDEKTYIESASYDERKSREEIYFLVDAKENDEYADVMYKKLEETLEAKIKRGDSVVTFGTRVNLIAQKLELNIIQHFSYDVYENQNEFINKVATLIETGFKNELFTDATLIIAQQNQDNRELVMKKLAPFEKENSNDIYENDESIKMNKTSTTDFDANKQNAEFDYLNYFKDLDVKSLSWIPNISFFKLKLIKAIVKQNVVEMTMIERIQRLKLEIQLLDEKRSKINEELVGIKRLVNRVRREKETEASIVQYAAFKVRSAGKNELEDVRKKKEEDDFLYHKTKGGVR